MCQFTFIHRIWNCFRCNYVFMLRILVNRPRCSRYLDDVHVSSCWKFSLAQVSAFQNDTVFRSFIGRKGV